ncbi:alginate export family protein [Reichenbachiella versicolor]|uniref:hypothetical protein n=1 Tax=Reichenbachiella versicolor TaxID=1821036 RepID=UPI0013A538F4|nr:hypothetical protein [Reichenbachiella versicolor]
MKKHLLTLVLLCASVASFAQMSITGEIRPRTELYNGANTGLSEKLDVPGTRIGLATQQRSRLYFSYKSEDLKIVFTPQLIHFWGQMPQAYDLLGDGAPGAPEPTFGVYEAYAEYKAGDMYSLKVGRQAISYKDQRWFGALGWAASGRAHDAFVNKFSFGDVKLDVGVALAQTRHTNKLDSINIAGIRTGYKSLQYAWLTLPAGDLTLDAMISNRTLGGYIGGQGGPAPTRFPSEIEYSNETTIGILPTFKSASFTLNASAYVQTREGNKGLGYLAAFDITSKALGLPLTLGVDVVSGESSDDEGSNLWQQPFGTNHKFYGFMDYFYVGESVKGGQGLTDIYAKAVFKTGEKSKLVVMPHVFKTTLAPEGIQSDGFFGTELDFVYIYQVSADFNFTLGYSKMFATSYMSSVYGGDHKAGQNWAWMQLTFKPKFL